MEFPGASRYSQRRKADLGDSDEFRMYHCKILPCRKRYSHDWSDCVFAHAGEKVQRRCPRKYKYIGFMCPDMRKQDGVCPRGENCCFAHNSFEYWLHPSRYRTELCTFGLACKRPVCFFAHTPAELRAPNGARPAVTVPNSYMSGTAIPDMMQLPSTYQDDSQPQAQYSNQALLGRGMVDFPYDTNSPQFNSAVSIKPTPMLPYNGPVSAYNNMRMQYNDTQADIPHLPYMESPSSSSQDSSQFNSFEQQAMPRMSAPQHTPSLSSPQMLLFAEPNMLPIDNTPLPGDVNRMYMKQNASAMVGYNAANQMTTGYVNQQAVANQQWPSMF